MGKLGEPIRRIEPMKTPVEEPIQAPAPEKEKTPDKVPVRT